MGVIKTSQEVVSLSECNPKGSIVFTFSYKSKYIDPINDKLRSFELLSSSRSLNYLFA